MAGDAELTAIYDKANNHEAGKLKPITTAKIFAAMRACLAISSPLCSSAELDQINELRFYKENGFPFFDHSNGSKGFEKIQAGWRGEPFDESDSGYWAITLPKSIPHPDGEGTVAGIVIHAYTVDKLYAKAVAHMASLERPKQPDPTATVTNLLNSLKAKPHD